MPYNINRYNGAIVAVVEDGTVDNTLDIKLIGRNYAGYGEVQNENLVHLLENFAGTSEPPRKIAGQIWYDSSQKKLKFFDGTKFRVAGGSEVGDVQPGGMTVGDFWFNTDTKQLYTWNGSAFTLIGPQAVENAGTTELKSISVVDTNNITHPVVQGLVNNQTVFIISSTTFTLALDSSLRPTFTVIRQGVNLIGTNVGESHTVNESDPDLYYNENFGKTSGFYKFWGTSSSALKLVGIDGATYTADDFIEKENPEFTGGVFFDDSGLTVGNDNDIKFFIDNGNPTFENVINNAEIIFKTKLSTDLVTAAALRMQGKDILPGVAGSSKLGRSDQKFSAVHALEFIGSLTGTADYAAALNVGGTYLSGSVDTQANKVVARDSSGNINANRFVGIANFADDLKGGGLGSIVYQSATDNTAFLPLGSEDQVLTVGPSNTLDWRPISDLVSTGSATEIEVTQANLINTDHYITFVSGTSSFQELKIDTSTLKYNPNSNTLTAGFFNGQANSAAYADLAEKYLADKAYEVGTVLMVGGEKEVTACQVGRRAIGAVSANPAYLMNKDLEGGTAVALKGRVPVKVRGAVIKGQKLIAGEDGAAVVSPVYSGDVFAIALESNDSQEVKLVECIIL
jgi:hypothetical protein